MALISTRRPNHLFRCFPSTRNSVPLPLLRIRRDIPGGHSAACTPPARYRDRRGHPIEGQARLRALPCASLSARLRLHRIIKTLGRGARYRVETDERARRRYRLSRIRQTQLQFRMVKPRLNHALVPVHPVTLSLQTRHISPSPFTIFAQRQIPPKADLAKFLWHIHCALAG